MHRLQLRVLIVKPLERADCDQLAAAADAEESDRRIEQAIHLERVRILWRAVQTPELQMMLNEPSHLLPGGEAEAAALLDAYHERCRRR